MKIRDNELLDYSFALMYFDENPTSEKYKDILCELMKQNWYFRHGILVPYSKNLNFHTLLI